MVCLTTFEKVPKLVLSCAVADKIRLMKQISTKDIGAWLARLNEKAAVYVPIELPGGGAALDRLSSGPIVRNYIRLAEAPKRILFPQDDDIVKFDAGRASAVLDRTDRIIFGLRPCDAAAIAITDEFFSRDRGDPNYLARRKRMLLIVCACRKSQDTCFCASARSGPVAAGGFDVQIFDFGETTLVETGSEQGGKLIEAGGELFRDAPANAAEMIREFADSAAASQRKLDLDRARKIIDSYGEPEGFWEKIGDRCLMCAGCAFICPTCTCYNIADSVTGSSEKAGETASGVRRRIWDSCVLGGFTREASGHNPRGKQWVRCAHRYQHKLGGMDLPEGQFRCVGCGRCADACITNLGIISVIEELLVADELRAEKSDA